ncbi:MAG: phenylalanine--tRNA ligase subunit beta [Phycisphaerales bacterium]|nr:phenylalanine--tRNA ligase subunit beta [Phycisphaerales bacterium]
MKISVAWLNRYLSPPTVTADEAEQVLMHVGFPIESREPLPGGDTRLDVEITSNRGDCLSHVGLAREIAAKTGRTLVLPKADLPAPRPGLGKAADLVKLENTRPDLCPLFTIRVIRGVKVGGSPAWLRDALEAVGQRSISNVVDASNYVNFELGNPSHAFDMARLGGAKVVVRTARPGEKLTTLDGKARELSEDDLVVADGDRAQGIAGVMGGGDSEVSAGTTDVVLEVATWAPVAVRKSSRRHGLRTDASYRYERIVDARSLDYASRRVAAIILETAGGSLCEGVVQAGRDLPSGFAIPLRPSRVAALMGVPVLVDEIARILQGLDIRVEPVGRGGEQLSCTPPHWRPDLTREVDLIEEVARVRGLDQIPVTTRVQVEIRPPQNSERAQREVASLLAGMGFFETVTFSFVKPAQATDFLLPGQASIGVDDDRRGAEPTLRPSMLPSLLACRRKNQDGAVSTPGGVRLFEFGATFAQVPPATSAGPQARGEVVQPRRLALLMDIPGSGVAGKRTFDELQTGLRTLRGSLEAVVRAMAGAGVRIEVRSAPPLVAAVRADSAGDLLVNGNVIGCLGIITDKLQAEYGLECPVAAAEVNLQLLLDLYPPKAKVSVLPAFPAVERDVTIIVPEAVRWDAVEKLVSDAALDKFESLGFVGAYRGKQLGAGKKSLTMRLWFRDAERTLRREEVDPQVESLIGHAKERLGAEVRTA